MSTEVATNIRCNPPLRLTIKEAAEIATVSPITIRRAIKDGKLKYKRLGVRIIIKLKDLDAWIDGGEGSDD